MSQCEGNCKPHSGDIVTRVRVVDPKSGKDWGEWLYCAEAIDRDRSQGFEVTDVTVSDAEGER
jgi:hypothetical protein